MMNRRDKEFNRTWRVVQTRLDAVCGDPMKLPIPIRTVALVATAQGIIDNGGFRYFFGGNFPNTPPYSIFFDAYRRIGADEAGEQIKKAVSMFPMNRPHRHQEKRKEYMDSIDENSDFFKIEGFICGNKNVWDLLYKYIDKHFGYFTA